ncbi:MAG: T9SS type A sorting domain-containing protein [Flavobacteriales bacterium]
MKNIFTFLIVSTSLFGSAQAILQNSNVGFGVGDSFTLHTVYAGLSAGSSGENVTWDFSNLAPGTSATTTVIAPEDAPMGSSFPNSNGATDAGGGVYGFFSVTAASYSFCGINTGFSVAFYDDPQDFLRFPFTYGDSYADPYHSNFTSGVDFERTGTMTVEADAWGTLILPWGTVQNAVRIHATEEAIDESDVLDLTYFTDYYTWYAPGFHGSVLSYSAQSVDGGDPSEMYIYSAEVQIDVAETATKPALSIYPNPAREMVNFKVAGDVEFLEITDAQGRLVEQISVVTSAFTLDLSHLPAGIYLVAITGNERREVQQLIKN